MAKLDLRSAIEQKILIGDGAMGTYLYQMGFPVGISYEELNLLNPNVIADVHRRYYEAGARFIETNTFQATKGKLEKFGLENRVEELNRKGVEIARNAVGSDAYIVGAVGSIRASRRKNIQTAQVERDFRQQIEILLDAGVDGLILESFFDLEELRIALQIVRSLDSLPVICQFATEGSGNTHDGVSLTDAFQTILDEGADIIGFNCRSGPTSIMRSLENIPSSVTAPFSIFPNAGIPDYIDGRYTYMATPEYFAESALQFADLGARIIGGCCGTTPEHIAHMAQALEDYVPTAIARGGHDPGSHDEERADMESIKVVSPHPITEKPTFKLAELKIPPLLQSVKQRYTVIVELDPPRDLDITKFMKGAKALKEAKVDALTMADNSLAMTRMSNTPLGFLLKEQVGVRPLLHIACRDRNLLGTQSHLMGLHAIGLDHVLAVTGDPSRFGDLPGSSSVYDLTSFEMIRMIKQLNKGISFSGKPLKQKANFVIGGAFNPHVKQWDKAIKRLERKVEAGMDYVMTQPIYDLALFEKTYEMTKHLDIPVFIGIMPLISGRNAEYLHNEVPGIQLSDEVRERMAGLQGPEGRAMGTQIAKELLDEAMKYFHGIYLMTPMLFYEMTVDLTHYIRKQAQNPDYHLYPLSK